VKVLSHESSNASKLKALQEAVMSSKGHHPNVVGAQCRLACLVHISGL
jgi:hypothetical protein